MRSMTGCGRASAQQGTLTVTADVRTVNHRFLDVACRLPKSLAFLDETVRAACAAQLKRGHAEVSLTVTDTAAPGVSISMDEALAKAYAEIGRNLAGATGLPDDLTVSRLMQLEGVIRTADAPADEEAVRSTAAEALTAALTALAGMRRREGDALRADLAAHLSAVAALRNEIAELAPQVVVRYRERLTARLNELTNGAEIDPARLAQEVALMADRCAVDEELSRLSSHIAQFEAFLDADGEIGKKMDFLIQEMNREANTIGSKANDAAIAHKVVLLKSEIEKLREQVQNVE